VGQDDGVDLRGRHAGLHEAGDELAAGRAEGGAAAGVDQHQFAADAHEQVIEGDVDAGRGQQGRLEYPALFDEAAAAQGIQAITARLTPGFTAGQGSPPGGGLGGMVRRALIDPGFRGQVAGRAWEVLKTEGVGGFLRRLRP
jgi:hypothetical protein